MQKGNILLSANYQQWNKTPPPLCCYLPAFLTTRQQTKKGNQGAAGPASWDLKAGSQRTEKGEKQVS